MRYPNLRYGNPTELQYYAMTIPIKDLAKRLRRSERSVRDWMTGTKKVPWWVPEILRLQKMETDARMYEMRMKPVMQRLGVVTPDAQVFEFPIPRVREPEIHNRQPEAVDAVQSRRLSLGA